MIFLIDQSEKIKDYNQVKQKVAFGVVPACAKKINNLTLKIVI